MHDPSPRQLRRAWLSGYRVADVEVLLAQFSLRISQMWDELQSVKARLETSERERKAAAERLEEARRRELDLQALLSTGAALVERSRNDAERKANEIIDAAYLDAARLRADAAREAESLRGQVDELLRLRDTLASTVRAASRDVERALNDEPPRPAPVERVAAPVASAPVATPPPFVAAPAPLRTAATGNLYDERVQVEAGPFEDFASLSAFERALGTLPNVDDVYIRRFEGDRATIDLTLAEPSALLDAMAERLPYNLNVSHADGDRIALDVSTG